MTPPSPSPSPIAESKELIEAREAAIEADLCFSKGRLRDEFKMKPKPDAQPVKFYKGSAHETEKIVHGVIAGADPTVCGIKAAGSSTQPLPHGVRTWNYLSVWTYRRRPPTSA
jgi:hypothetical protein